MYVCVLASGSKGNCIYICDKIGTAILVDAGLSWKATKAIADDKGINLNRVKAIIVTHEHIDHYSGAAIISNKLGGIPIYFKKEVIDNTQKNIPEDAKPFYVNLTIRSLTLMSFKTSHDSLAPMGLLIRDKANTIIGISTDLGKTTSKIIDYLKYSKMLLLESNHDEDMLWNGDYPEHLKIRIASDNGHLSNKQAAMVINSLDPKITKHVVLCHISAENNSVEAIKKTLGEVLENKHPIIHIANQSSGSSLFHIV